jgi:predicted amidohydrolase
MKPFSLSLAQTHPYLGKPQKNFEKAIHFIRSAVQQGNSLILFPELWTSGYDLENASLYAKENLLILKELARMAQESSIFIGGSYLLERSGKIYNTFILLTPDQKQSYSYSKIHLFRLMQEDKYLTVGDQIITADLDIGLAGLAICYDLRFPEIFRHSALQGTEMFLLPAEWPKKRIDHWKTLVRARAIENQSFFFAVNCTGKIGNEIFGGKSVILDPWGNPLAEASGNHEELISASIDPSQVEKIRTNILVFQDRRPDIYSTYK